MIIIVPISEQTLYQARNLVNKVFTRQSLGERLSFLAFSHKNNIIIRSITRLFGVKEMMNFWVAINENSEVVGTTGLYKYLADEKEAVWLAWFCVDPNERGKGIGNQLLSFTIEEARRTGVSYLRLYTSDDPNEKEAQVLYEKYGLKEKEREAKLFYTKIIRELRLEHLCLSGESFNDSRR
jgi:GNAT superfamily N-acetyltransferase